MFDVLTIGALADEFGRELIGGRVQKTIQIDAMTVGLEIYAERQRRFLIASADNQNPRILLSASKQSADPDRVSPLLLLLRKYVRGGQIVSIQQPPLERIIRIGVAKRFWPDRDDDHAEEPDDAAVEESFVELIVELMGRRSNIILVNDAGRVLDAVKRVTPDMSRQRPVLPGKPYLPPPPQDRRDPRTTTGDDIDALLAEVLPGSDLPDMLVRGFAGFSPQMAREATFRALGETRRMLTGDPLDRDDVTTLARAVRDVIAPLENGQWEPVVYSVDDEPIAFAAIRLLNLAGEADEERFDSMSAAVEHGLAAGGGATPARYAQRRAKLVAPISEAVARVEARLRSLQEQAERAEQAEQLRRMGELIYAYLYVIEPGQAKLVAEGVSIPLDSSRSPSENAQDYFERYRKAQSAGEHLPELIEQARTEVAYLRELQTLASLAEGIDDLEQIRLEWEAWRQQQRAEAPGKDRHQKAPKQPRPLRSSRGDLIYVGHNGRQNEIVTFDLAAPDDLWLHARGLPGAHVVVRWHGEPDPNIVERAASLAAWYSGGRESTRVEVDATERRYVRKIKGAGPGMVTYRNERTLNVRPLPPDELGLTAG